MMPFKNLENAQKFIILRSSLNFHKFPILCSQHRFLSLSLKLDRKVNKYFGQENNEADEHRGAF